MRKGVAVSPGVSVARAYRLDELDCAGVGRPSVNTPSSPDDEVRRFDSACGAVIQELDITIARVADQLGEDKAGIFRAHRTLLKDPALASKVKERIVDQQVDVRTALRDTLAEYADLFLRIEDEYLKERLADLRDVIGRLLAQLECKEERPSLELGTPVILVAMEILPSQVIGFDRLHVVGIITESGGATGHAAILARSLGIPAVSGLPGILSEVRTGDLVALDGRAGGVFVRPSREVENAYRTLQREYVDLRSHLVENCNERPITNDGILVELLANINTEADAATAAQFGASGIGLYRTEYLFLAHSGVPNEEEQRTAYRAVAEAAPNRTVTIRTLDIGGDKQLRYLDDQHEMNPALGWRSTRYLLEHPQFLATQLRAILGAAQDAHVSMLFPMVSTLDEVWELKRLVDRSRKWLYRQGVTVPENVPFGIMLEVPAAASCLDDLLDEVDFVSIGSNDLIQYLMAADRNNPNVAHLCEPFSPAIFRLLHSIIKACDDRQKPVTLCGEMAGLLRCFLPLFGMGLRRFSMSPAFIPPLKDLLMRITQPMAQTIAEQVLKAKTSADIRALLASEVRQIWPAAVLLDSDE